MTTEVEKLVLSKLKKIRATYDLKINNISQPPAWVSGWMNGHGITSICLSKQHFCSTDNIKKWAHMEMKPPIIVFEKSGYQPFTWQKLLHSQGTCNWSGKHPIWFNLLFFLHFLTAVTCPKLPTTIANGNITTSTRTFRSQATIKCDLGFEIISFSTSTLARSQLTIQCMANGKWSAPPSLGCSGLPDYQ